MDLLTYCVQAKLQESNIMDMSGRFQLDVDINTVIFRHHHMFSKEHVLAAQLSQQFEEYVSRTKRQVTEYLTGKVKFIRGRNYFPKGLSYILIVTNITEYFAIFFIFC